MKAKIIVELNLPHSMRLHADELCQLLYDAYVNYVTVKHCEDALTWCVEGNVGKPDEDPAKKQIHEYHRTWGKITGAAKVNYEFEYD
jgi:hypothetical protein